ncbi:hypothetical protein ACFLVE_01695 [Chloroflexota bacterium]
MSQENKDKADAAEARTQQTRGFMQQVRVASRRKYTPEEKVRIVLEGFRREATNGRKMNNFRKQLTLGDVPAMCKDCDLL